MKMVNPNAFEVLAVMRDLYRQTDRKAEWPAAEAELKAGDYQHLADTAKRLSFGAVVVVTDADDDE